jgi:FRG domain
MTAEQLCRLIDRLYKALTKPCSSKEGNPMNGQWTGTYSGTNTGRLVADLDDIGTSYAGVAFAYDSNVSYPRTFAYVELPKQQCRFTQPVVLQPVERGTGQFVTKDQLAQRFPGVQVPEHANTEWEITPKEISLSCRTNIGTNGVGKMVKSEGASPSTLKARADVRSWEDFKKFVLTLEPYRFAFRGHGKNTWRLRTSFHRSGRASLIKFQTQDVPALHRHLSGLTTHRFNLGDPLDYAAFLNLAQHHGYPTPILDWTQSPFVAAYFGFKDLSRDDVPADQKIRIIVFDVKVWSTMLERAAVIMPGFLHMTFLEPLATNNPRALPQQSISTVTNIDDLELYIREMETTHNKSFMFAIDLPGSERRLVMQDLALMGITAGSLFPGIDGACLQLKERFFDL